VELPTYPFQRERFWLEPIHEAIGAGKASSSLLGQGSHPLLGRRIHSAHAPQAIVFESVIGGSGARLVDESAAETSPALQQTVLEQMAQAAAETVAHGNAVRMEPLAIEEPLPLSGDPPRVVQLVLIPKGPTSFRLEIFSRIAKEPRDAPTWTRHASTQLHTS